MIIHNGNRAILVVIIQLLIESTQEMKVLVLNTNLPPVTRVLHDSLQNARIYILVSFLGQIIIHRKCIFLVVGR